MSTTFVTTRCGDRFLVRPIRPDDKPRLQAGLAALSQETVRRRFLSAKPKFSSRELRYLTEIDGHDHIALVAVPLGRPDRIVAVARAVRLADRPGTAELAIVVGDSLQRRGLGSELARLVAEAARREGIERIAGTMLLENEAAYRLMRRLGAPVLQQHSAWGVREVVIELAPAPVIAPLPLPLPALTHAAAA